mmetsp:Transcript_16471/g.26778  ORF Transcript_16471/g.26778 Transcript_16471/m.26778 type:complete len:226 (+) Transcript_16471:757-1434(+)
MPIRAVIFDLDGLMIDSEPLWHQAEKEVFGSLGVEMTDDMCLESTGLRVDEVVAHHQKRRPWNGEETNEQVTTMLVNKMDQLLREQPKPMKGLKSALEFFKSKNVHMGVASSSPLVLIKAALGGLNIESYFEFVCSANDESYGKPHPAVYLRAASKCEIPPTECLALEDSMNGALAAKSARMKCIAIPDLSMCNHDLNRFAFCDVTLDSLEQVNESVWRGLYEKH